VVANIRVIKLEPRGQCPSLLAWDQSVPAPLQLLQQAFLVPGDRLLQLPAWQPVLLWGWPLEQPLLAERRPVRKPELLPAATIAAALAAEQGIAAAVQAVPGSWQGRLGASR